MLQTLTILLSFVVRTVFIRTLGKVFLGINGLFDNILQMLSLAELGVGTAITYSMYRPMAENDTAKVNILLKLYKKVYIVVGSVVLIAGLCLSPFLDYFISDKPNIPNLVLYYVIYVVNSASTYFFIYKTSVIIVAQNEYIITIRKMAFVVLKYVAEIIVLLFLKSYTIYLVASVFSNISCNISISKKAEKLYPFIKEKVTGNLPKEEKVSIVKNIGALFFHRIGNVAVNATDNLIISKILGLTLVGLYSNYLLIINTINTFINILYNNITASVGNVNVTETLERKYQVYKNIAFTNFWIACFCSTSLIVLLNPFISLWIGDEYLLDINIVIILVANCYFKIIRKSTLIFRNAMGLFWNDRYKPLFEAAVNLVASVILAVKYGIIGVFVGTLISTLTTCFWIEPWILYKYGFNKKVIEYFKMFFGYFIVTFFIIVLTYALSNMPTVDSLLKFIIKALISLSVPNMIFILLYHRSEEFLYIKGLVKNYAKKNSR